MTDDTENTVRVVAQVPQSVKDAAKDKLEYGGLSREIQDTLERIAFGEELGQRSRLERRREELAEQLREKREKRRETDADIENLEQRIDAVENDLSNLTSREDKYEARLEALETRLRVEGQRLDPEHAAVRDAAVAAGVEPEGVVETLKERNPDVPAYAFQQALHDRETWDGLPESEAQPDVEDREGVR